MQSDGQIFTVRNPVIHMGSIGRFTGRRIDLSCHRIIGGLSFDFPHAAFGSFRSIAHVTGHHRRLHQQLAIHIAPHGLLVNGNFHIGISDIVAFSGSCGIGIRYLKRSLSSCRNGAGQILSRGCLIHQPSVVASGHLNRTASGRAKSPCGSLGIIFLSQRADIFRDLRGINDVISIFILRHPCLQKRSIDSLRPSASEIHRQVGGYQLIQLIDSGVQRLVVLINGRLQITSAVRQIQFRLSGVDRRYYRLQHFRPVQLISLDFRNNGISILRIAHCSVLRRRIISFLHALKAVDHCLQCGLIVADRHLKLMLLVCKRFHDPQPRILIFQKLIHLLVILKHKADLSRGNTFGRTVHPDQIQNIIFRLLRQLFLHFLGCQFRAVNPIDGCSRIKMPAEMQCIGGISDNHQNQKSTGNSKKDFLLFFHLYLTPFLNSVPLKAIRNKL